jgi:hypothetical protein
MTLYSLMLFVHVTSDIGIFVGIGAWLLGFAALRRAQDVSQVRALATLIHRTEPLSVVSALLTIASGLYMLLTVWGWQTAWAVVALGSIIVCLPPLLLGAVEPRMRTILRLASQAHDGPVPAPVRTRIHDPVLGASLHALAAVLLGIVFLMTTKPALAGAIAVMVAAIGSGAVAGLALALNRPGDLDHPRATTSRE